MNTFQQFAIRNSAPKNLPELVNGDLKRYCANMVLKSLVAGKYELNPSTLNDSCKAVLATSNSSQPLGAFLKLHRYLLDTSTQMLSTSELSLLASHAIYRMAKRHVPAAHCVDPVLTSEGRYVLDEAAARENVEKLRGRHSLLSKACDVEAAVKCSGTAIAFTDDVYGSNIYSALLRYSLFNI